MKHFKTTVNLVVGLVTVIMMLIAFTSVLVGEFIFCGGIVDTIRSVPDNLRGIVRGIHDIGAEMLGDL